MKARYTALAALTIFVAVQPAFVSLAADDDGVRSVFARGAGERALALGGAYGAVSGDPTTLYWNPAGLGSLDRSTLAASHTNLIGMGFYEQYGTVALPSWRLGTFALSFRRFGVDGIEGRDDRGTLTSDDLRDSESELSLGYAKSLSKIWQVGAALKFQRQELAGQSGGGLGLDAGLIVRPALAFGGTSAWAEGLSLGLTFRNLIEPNIRLETDEVRDPSGLRAGAALGRPLGSSLGALVALDVEKTKDMDTRLHAGVEVALFDVVAIRLGSNHGTLAAGLGAHWRDLSIQYAFEDNTLAPVHRFGLNIGFGHTVEERHQAALDSREKELNERMARAFSEENQHRVALALKAVNDALAAEDFQVALDRVRALEVIAPENPDAPRLEAKALLGQGTRAEQAGELTAAMVSYQNCLRVDPGNPEARSGLTRVTTESEHLAQRDEQIRTVFRSGMDAFGAGDLELARDLFAQALELAPNDTEMREFARHVDDAIRMQAEVDHAQESAREATILAEAESKAAAEALKAASATETPGEDLATPVVAATVPSYADLSEARRREIASLYNQGIEAAGSGRRDDAIRYWELVWTAAPDYQQVSNHLKQEYQALGMDAFSEGRLDHAIVIWEQALEVDPADLRTQGYIERALEHRARMRQIRSE